MKLEAILEHARSLLVVPGHRPDRFDKAANSGADAIMLDLEDSVGPERKPEARKNIDTWLAERGEVVVRINGVDTRWHNDDVAMVREHGCPVMLPKTTTHEQVDAVISALGEGAYVIPALETASGVLNARSICSANGVVRVIFGNADFASDLGVKPDDWEALSYARSHIVLASAACELPPPFDGVTVSINDNELLADDAQRAVAAGFTGKACLHPRQVPLVNRAFSPSPDDVQWARSVLAQRGDGSVRTLNGQVVGEPMVKRAQRLLSRVSIPASS